MSLGKSSLCKRIVIEQLAIDEKHEHSWGCSSSRCSVSHLSFGVNIQVMFSFGKRYTCLGEWKEAQIVVITKSDINVP